DLLSVTGSIIAILQLSGKVVCYLNDVKDASKDRAKCAIEAANACKSIRALLRKGEDGRIHFKILYSVEYIAFRNEVDKSSFVGISRYKIGSTCN
ncbi:hypothetical protein K505DRAFT_232718, partial [Melanomma pulvis-pyrius CBS 109.77]